VTIEVRANVSDVRVNTATNNRQTKLVVQAAAANPTSWSADRPRPGRYIPNNSPTKKNNIQAIKLHIVIDWFKG